MLNLVQHGLATWRLSSLLVHERGPFDVFVHVRRATGIVHYDDGSVAQADAKNPLSCIWCTSVLVAFALCFVPEGVLRALAASAISVAVSERVINGES